MAVPRKDPSAAILFSLLLRGLLLASSICEDLAVKERAFSATLVHITYVCSRVSYIPLGFFIRVRYLMRAYLCRVLLTWFLRTSLIACGMNAIPYGSIHI